MHRSRCRIGFPLREDAGVAAAFSHTWLCVYLRVCVSARARVWWIWIGVCTPTCVHMRVTDFTFGINARNAGSPMRPTERKQSTTSTRVLWGGGGGGAGVLGSKPLHARTVTMALNYKIHERSRSFTQGT